MKHLGLAASKPISSGMSLATRTQCKRLVALLTFVCTLIGFVMFGWQNSGNVDRTDITFGRPRLKLQVPASEELTKTNMASIHANATSDLSSPEFLECYPGPILKYLEDSGNLTRFNGCVRVLYNRVPKCGSRTILSTIKVLSERLNYTVYSRTRENQASFFPSIPKLVEFGQAFSDLREPYVYSQHLHFVNFTQLGVPPPLYTNVVREPLERLLSHYFYSQYGSTNDPQEVKWNFTLDECVTMRSCPHLPLHHVIPYFCGQAKHCRTSSRAALQNAKLSLRKNFLVVGVTEDIPAFLEVLETLIPQFFTNASRVFQELKESLHNKTKTVKKPFVKPETKEALKKLLAYEYDFYEYTKQRFYNIYNKVNVIKNGISRQRRGLRNKSMRSGSS